MKQDAYPPIPDDLVDFLLLLGGMLAGMDTAFQEAGRILDEYGVNPLDPGDNLRVCALIDRIEAMCKKEGL